MKVPRNINVNDSYMDSFFQKEQKMPKSLTAIFGDEGDISNKKLADELKEKS